MKTVLITGGSRGIGAACARLFAAEGYKVLINYEKSEAAANDLCKELGCEAFKFDVSDRNAVLNFKESLEARGITVDVLINNAGVSLFGLFQYVDAEAAERMYGVNLFGTVNCIRTFLPQMVEKKDGVIINLSSVWGEVGASCEADYSAAKAAVIGLTKALAKEVGFSGVRVNCLSPGVIDTDMNANLSVADVEEIVNSIPLERLGKGEDVAKAALFLASDSASYITGQVLSVDGGWKG
ncbi:MAG: SDR family oxidoreductase [Ruminococcaceae bacterium]|nr:SDR family oxidoreductase [Oscillospiraceae bacterium]